MIEIFVSDKCPHCSHVIENYKKDKNFYGENSILINISSSLSNLKKFLSYRDNLDNFKTIKYQGKIGIPVKIIDENIVEFFEQV